MKIENTIQILSLFSVISTLLYLFYKFRGYEKRISVLELEYEKRISGLELAATRELIGENKQIVDDIINTQIKLRNQGGLTSSEALREAKALHGMK